jgi:apolipoprotein N-acyltransferase
MNRGDEQSGLPKVMDPPRGHGPWQSAIMVLMAGAAHAVSMAWPGFLASFTPSWLGVVQGQPVWWLQLLALGTLAYWLDVCQSASPGCSPARQATLRGWLFATAWLVGSFGWTFVAMHTYGGLPAPLAGAAVFVLAGLLALCYAAACGYFVLLAPVNHSWAAIVFAAIWLMAELVRGTWLTGFGWGASGYAHVDGPLAAYAPWLGVYGVGALAAWLAWTLAAQLRPGVPGRERLSVVVLVLTVLAAPGLYQAWAPPWSSSNGRLGVTLLQGNIPQDEKFEVGTGVPQALRWYGEQLQASTSALVIAPETAIPLLPQQLPAEYWGTIQQRFASGRQAALVGTPLGDERLGYTNSVLGLKPGLAQPWRYDKHHLVPFGEFIPPFFKWFTAMMNIPLGDFNRGALVQPSFEWQGQRLAPNICYENLFGEELAPNFLESALAPTIFVNVSNLAWFGDGLALDQHLQISRMRALEFARPFALATNTGVTAIVDHQGRVVSSLPRAGRAVLVSEIEGRSGVTPYAWWVARLGLWPWWLLAIGVLGVAVRHGRQKGR